jgi:hypothetical protein
VVRLRRRRQLRNRIPRCPHNCIHRISTNHKRITFGNDLLRYEIFATKQLSLRMQSAIVQDVRTASLTCARIFLLPDIFSFTTRSADKDYLRIRPGWICISTKWIEGVKVASTYIIIIVADATVFAPETPCCWRC